MSNEIVLYESSDGEIILDVNVQEDTVWLTQADMVALFDKNQSTIARHINNAFNEGEVSRESNMQKMHNSWSDKPITYYDLDVVISVGYRVKSQRGVEFRKWANTVLKSYILQGYAINHNRINQLNQVVQIMKRIEGSVDAKQVLSVIERYSAALDLLDDYDHQTLKKPKGSKGTYVLTYEECRHLIDNMKFASDSDLFGNEKDDSFKGSLGAIYQSFGGVELYDSLEEKAANLLYFITKNHSFSDGNKRIAAALFLYFLDCNDALFENGAKRLDDYTLTALTIMIAESKPEEKEVMVSVVMNCLEKKID